MIGRCCQLRASGAAPAAPGLMRARDRSIAVRSARHGTSARRPKQVFASCGCGAPCATRTREILNLLRQGAKLPPA